MPPAVPRLVYSRKYLDVRIVKHFQPNRELKLRPHANSEVLQHMLVIQPNKRDLHQARDLHVIPRVRLIPLTGLLSDGKLKGAQQQETAAWGNAKKAVEIECLEMRHSSSADNHLSALQ